MALKTFTEDEANAQLPQVEELLTELQEVRDKILTRSSVLEGVMAHARDNGGSKAAGEYLLLLQRFYAATKMLQEIGCELKDLNSGLVDFPSYRNGELVYLCWKRGEPRIAYWHTLEGGFSARQPL